MTNEAAGKRGMRPGSRSRTAAMAAELSLLVVFVYLPLIVGAFVVGWLATGRQRVHESNHYALLVEGDQSETRDDRGEVTTELFREFTGEVAVAEGDADEPDIPAPDEIQDLFEKWTEKTYYVRTSVSAHGSFHLEGGRVVYRESVRVTRDEGWHMDPEGSIVEALKLLDDDIPRHITEELVDFLRRRTAHTNYYHSWKEQGRDLDQDAWSVNTWTEVVGPDLESRGLVPGGSWDALTRQEQEDVWRGLTDQQRQAVGAAAGEFIRQNVWVRKDDGLALRNRYDEGSTPWNLTVPNDARASRDEWHPEAAIRWVKTRMIGDQSPPGADQRSDVGLPNILPDYEACFDFWHPSEGTPEEGGGELPGPVEGF